MYSTSFKSLYLNLYGSLFLLASAPGLQSKRNKEQLYDVQGVGEARLSRRGSGHYAGGRESKTAAGFSIRTHIDIDSLYKTGSGGDLTSCIF